MVDPDLTEDERRMLDNMARDPAVSREIGIEMLACEWAVIASLVELGMRHPGAEGMHEALRIGRKLSATVRAFSGPALAELMGPPEGRCPDGR